MNNIGQIYALIDGIIKEYSGGNLYNTSGAVDLPTLSFNNVTNELTVGTGKYRTHLESTDFSDKLVEFVITEQVFTLSMSVPKYYICVRYNSGSPLMYLETDINQTNDSNILVVYTIYTDSDELDVLNWGAEAIGLSNKINERLIDTQRFGIVPGGFALSTSNLIITITGGDFYLGTNRISTTQIDSTTNECELIYKNGSNGWNSLNVDTYSNTQYDNGSGILGILPDGKYGVVWVWKSAGNNNEMYIALGGQPYDNIELAKQSKTPSNLPERIQSGAFLVGRLIFLKNSTTASVESSFDTVFNASAPTIHNALTGLQGGTAGQYNHITNDEYTKLNKLITLLTNNDKAVVYEANIDNHTILQLNTYQKLIIPFTLITKTNNFTLDAVNNRLVYTGTQSKIFFFDATSSVLNAGSNNMTIHFIVRKNGNINLNQTESAIKLDQSSSIGSINAASAIVLNQNDYIEIFAYSDKTSTFSTAHMQLQLVEDIGNTFNL